MPEVIWLPDALDDFSRLYGFLVEKNPDAARRAAETLRAGARMLAVHPDIGKLMNDETGRRELFQAFGAGAFVLRYLVDSQTVFIIRVWHSLEDRH
jgi:plasmid stabilization system protein ParE